MPSYIKSLKSNLGDLIIPRTTAKAVTYDNSTSGLEAVNAQAAIDELSRDQKQIIPPKQVPGYTSIVSSSAMGQQSYGKTLSLDNIQGNTVLGGTPAYNAPVSMESVEGPLKLRVAGKNLVQPAWNLESQTQTGVTCTRTGNSFTLAGTNSGSVGINFYIQRYDTASAFSLPAGTYTLSGMPARAENKSFLLGLYHRLPGGTNEQLATDYGNPSRSKQTFTLGEATDSLFLVIVVGVGVNADGVTVTPQIEVGSEFTDYEEPSNTTVEIPLIGKDGQSLEPLRMSYIGYVATKAQNPDCIVLKNGVWYVKRTTAQLDLTNATWVKGSSYFAIRMDGKLIPGAQSKFVLCTHFPGSGEASNSGGIWGGTGLALQNDAVPDYATNEWMAEFCAEQAQAGTPVTVVYSLSEPIYEELHQDVQNILNTLTVPIDVCSVWFEGEVAPTADIGITRGDFPSENARALAMTRADRTLSNLTDYQKALHNIGGRPNRNLLINHRMIGTGNPGSFPVNQKGQKVYTPALNETTIDGWKIEVTDPGTAKVEIKDGFVTITNTSQTSGIQFKQTVPIEALSAGGEYTISSYIKEVSADVSCILAMTDPPYINPIRIKPVPNEIVSGTVTALPQVSSGSYKFIYEIPPGGFVTIADQKMEEGPIQTLGWIDDDGNVHLFETPDYGEELARCQRYGLFSGASDLNAVPMSIGQAFLPTPVTMRAKPVIVGTPVVYNADTNNVADGAIVSIIGVKQNGVVLQISGLSAPERSYVLFPISTGLSAEL